MSHLKPFLVAAIVLLAASAATVSVLHRYELVLTIRRGVPVRLTRSVPVHAQFDQAMDATLPGELRATARLAALSVPLHETLDVPIDTSIAVPLDTEVQIDQPLGIELPVPIDTVLTERALDLSQLHVPLDTDIFVDDVFDLDFVVPLDTEVQTALGIVVPVKGKPPIKARVPIHQRVHVKDDPALNLRQLRIPLHTTIPIRTTLPFKHTPRVRGQIEVPIHQRFAIRSAART